MKLCIAEKPSVAKEIALILGAKSRKDGFYEGNGYWVSWTFGHLCSLKEPQDYNEQDKKWNMGRLPIIPARFGIKLINQKSIKKQFKTIENLVKRCDEVINCGDAGQEGELIQRWVLSLAKCKKPMKRLWISSLTEEAIKEGFEKLAEAQDFDNLYYAGASRAISDWLLGINATRLFTMKYGEGKGVLSIGRVQTPTLALVVNRHLEIQNFKPEPYWEIVTSYRDCEFSYQKGKFDQKDKAVGILEEIKNHPLEVTQIETKKGREHPPKLFDLTSLQVECNKRFGFSADQTLKIVQKLYESKVVTYPRVDTTFLPNDIYPKVKGILSNLSAYQELTRPLMDGTLRKSSKVFNDKKVTDHHAIIPTNKNAYGLAPVDFKVYDLIARRFIAIFYEDCEFSTTTVYALVNQIPFRARGKQILNPGFRVVFHIGKEEVKLNKDEVILPAFTQGESGPHQPELKEKMTTPPKEYTEATLLRAMETAGKFTNNDELREALKLNGIGRPSTRAAIIETLFKRKYIKKIKRNVIPTTIGIQLIEAIKDPTLKSVELTGQWEKKLREISDGVFSKDDFVEEMKKFIHDVVSSVKSDHGFKKIQLASFDKNKKNYSKPQSPGQAKQSQKTSKTKQSNAHLVCPQCQKGCIIQGKTAFGCDRYREGCHFRVPFVLAGKKVSQTQLKTLIQKKKSAKIKGFKKENGDKFEGYLRLNDNLKVEIVHG